MKSQGKKVEENKFRGSLGRGSSGVTVKGTAKMDLHWAIGAAAQFGSVLKWNLCSVNHIQIKLFYNLAMNLYF